MDSHTADIRTPCEGAGNRDTAGILDTEDIPPCVGAYRRVLPRNHGAAAADIPEAELLRLPLGEIHHDTHEAVEEDNHTEAAVLPACREAFFRPDDGHLPVVVADDDAEAACDAVAARVVMDVLPPLRILRRVVLVLLPFSLVSLVVHHLPWLLSVSLLRWAVPLHHSIPLVRSL